MTRETHFSEISPAGILPRIALLTLALLAPLLSAATPPNFVLIVVDDLGYGDIGPFGSEQNETPELDRLAREGLRFTDFHSNGPMCTPTRAALLTGRYQQRYGRVFEGPLSGKTQRDLGLPLSAFTVAEFLKDAGYATGMYGKWHLGYHPPLMPAHQGFDDFRGLTTGGGDHHSHIDRSGRKDWWRNDEIEMEAGYSTELLTGHSVDFIERNKDRPFFLYVPYLAIHFPWQGPGDEGYRVEGGDYWDLSKLGRLESKNIGPKVKEMVEAVDRGVGAIVAELEKHGLERNTLVFFTSDNGGYRTYQGGHYNISSNGPLRGQKGDVFEGGHRVPAIAWWPGRIEPGVSGATAMTFDLFPTFAELAGAGGWQGSLELDGLSLTPVFFRREMIESRTLFWRMREKRAVRHGPWKLVRLGEQSPLLYNLADEIGERRDLAAQRPEVVRQLEAELAEWESDVDGSAGSGDN